MHQQHRGCYEQGPGDRARYPDAAWVSKAVDLEVRINKLGENYNKVPTAGFSATATIKRSDFGITFFLPILPDEIRLEIEAEANHASAPT